MTRTAHVIAIDTCYADKFAKSQGYNHFPIRHLINKEKKCGVELVEVFATVIKRCHSTIDEMEWNEACLRRKIDAIASAGARPLVCPAKKSHNSPTGYKQSDDQILVATVLRYCLKYPFPANLKLTLVGADSDLAPMITVLREEGIQTTIISSSKELSNELRIAAQHRKDIRNYCMQQIEKAA